MRLKHTTLRLAGAAMIAAAVVPWLGGGMASAAASDDSDCATRPGGVPDTASCVVLDENTGQDPALHGETWAWRDADNDLHVSAFPVDALDGSDAVQLCVRDTAPYDAAFKCLGNDPTRVFEGDDLVLVIDLDAIGITPTEAAYYSIHVNQGGNTTVSSGNGGSVPGTPSSPPVSSSSPPVSSSSPPVSSSSAPVTSATSAAVVTTQAAAPQVSVLPTKVENTKAEASPETSVLAEAAELPHTGGGVPYLALAVISLGLLLAGGALMFLPGLSVERANRRH